MRELTEQEIDAIRHLVAAGGRRILPESIDWDLVLRSAHRHRLSSLVYCNLDGASRHVPDAFRKRIASAFHVELARSVVQHHTVEQLASIAGELGRPLLLLKGAAFRVLLYEHPGARPMADIDVLAQPADVPRFTAALRELDFEIQDAADHAIAFRSARTGTSVELHRSLTSCARTLGLDVDALFDRSMAVSTSMRTLSLEDHLLHLCLHASLQHGFRQAAINAWDAHLLVEQDTFSATTFVENFQNGRLAPWIASGLWMSQRVFPSTRLGELVDAFSTHRCSRTLRKVREIPVQQLLSPDPNAISGSPLRRLLWCNDPSMAVSLLVEVLHPRTHSTPRSVGAAAGRSIQLLRNHAFRDMTAALMKQLTTNAGPAPASLGELRDV